MNRTLIVSGLVLLLTANAAAAAPTDSAPDPGVIGADSALYPADVFLDGLLKPPGEQAHERASEALIAAEANDSAAMDRAVAEVNRVADQTNGVEAGDGLDQAKQVLQEAKEKTPADATIGLETALEKVEQAQNRFPTDEHPGTDSPETARP